jgi:hypothetical protein
MIGQGPPGRRQPLRAGRPGAPPTGQGIAGQQALADRPSEEHVGPDLQLASRAWPPGCLDLGDVPGDLLPRDRGQIGVAAERSLELPVEQRHHFPPLDHLTLRQMRVVAGQGGAQARPIPATLAYGIAPRGNLAEPPPDFSTGLAERELASVQGQPPLRRSAAAGTVAQRVALRAGAGNAELHAGDHGVMPDSFRLIGRARRGVDDLLCQLDLRGHHFLRGACPSRAHRGHTGVNVVALSTTLFKGRPGRM